MMFTGGSVVGVDVGCSPTRRSNAICRLDWTSNTAAFHIERFRSAEPERTDVLCKVIDRAINTAAFDGPLRSGLDLIGRYRKAELLLTRRLWKFIGKPGQSSTPVGRLLNTNANACAKTVLKTGHVARSAHTHAIHESAIVEAFPGAFMGLLIDEPLALHARRGNRSDKFYAHLADFGILSQLLEFLLPGRKLNCPFEKVTNHDERAAIVCALTALCVANGEYVAVGDREDGWIVLPPRQFIRPWAYELLIKNIAESESST